MVTYESRKVEGDVKGMKRDKRKRNNIEIGLNK
jgi:hypothetical protein